MKAIASAALFLVLIGRPADAQKQRDPLFGADKIKHFLVAGFVETMTFAGLQAAGAGRSAAKPAAIGAAVTASLGREIYDRRVKGHFSIRDLAWDALGIGAALLVLNKTQR